MKRGDVVGWVVICPVTGEWVLRCATRREARELAQATGARYARVVVE